MSRQLSIPRVGVDANKRKTFNDVNERTERKKLVTRGLGRIANKVMVQMAKMKRVFVDRVKLNVIHTNEKYHELNYPIVRSITHTEHGVKDVPYALEVLGGVKKDLPVVFAGEGITGSDKAILRATGAITFDRQDPIARKRAANDGVSALTDSGRDVAIFSAGTWNQTSYLPEEPAHGGDVSMAIETGTKVRAEVFVHRDNRSSLIVDDKLVDPSKYKDETIFDPTSGENKILTAKRQTSDEVYNKKATILWKVWETESSVYWDEDEQIYKPREGHENKTVEEKWKERECAEAEFRKSVEDGKAQFPTWDDRAETMALRRNWTTPEEVMGLYGVKSAFGSEHPYLEIIAKEKLMKMIEEENDV
ncbi:MAG: hypothetical protein LBM09_00325 [Candidatus Nomurabacteria bacterium]|jgi:hypothetical protein|nr:hypothetical protein [Candidatus Nomurabacteria bacterium]